MHWAPIPIAEFAVIWMLTMYAKNVAENIPVHVLRQIRRPNLTTRSADYAV
jgi:hypothetical protein